MRRHSIQLDIEQVNTVALVKSSGVTVEFETIAVAGARPAADVSFSQTVDLLGFFTRDTTVSRV